MRDWFSEIERTQLNSLFDLTHGIMENRVLDSYMKLKRKGRPLLSQYQRYELYESEGLIQLWFQTSPCRFSTMGKCTMCNYWNGQHIPGIVDYIINEVRISDEYHTLLINTCGSCLDTREVSYDELVKLLDWISCLSVQYVIFESHWTTLTNNILNLIDSKLSQKMVFYEIGIESTNEDSLRYFLNKPSSLTDIHEIIEKVHTYHAKCIMNVVLGVPFLNPDQQMSDAVESLHDLLDNGTDYLVIFPINIKPYTLIMDLYKNEKYSRVPAKIIANILLDNFSDSLQKINVAWFGDHLEDGVIPPASCDICTKDTIRLFRSYNKEDDLNRRQMLLNQIAVIHCDCIDKYLSFERRGTLFERTIKYYSELIEVMCGETT